MEGRALYLPPQNCVCARFSLDSRDVFAQTLLLTCVYICMLVRVHVCVVSYLLDTPVCNKCSVLGRVSLCAFEFGTPTSCV